MNQQMQELHEELMEDSREYCCYCWNEKRSVGCCGENHFMTYAEMYDEDQREFLESEYFARGN